MANLYRCGGGGETITKSTITVKTSSDNFEGLTVTLTNGSYTYKGVFANKECIFKVSYTGIYTASVTYGGSIYLSSEVNVNVIPSAYETTIEEGITVTYNVDGTLYSEKVGKGKDVLHPTTFTPSKSSHIFYGWALSSGATTRLKNLVAEDEDITLYALFISNTPITFSYTGNIQSFVAKEGVEYTLQVYGGKGGNSTSGKVSATGGKGGYSVGKKKFDTDTTLYIVCGGAGINGQAGGSIVNGGYNGGGYAECSSLSGSGGGGGATHIGLTNALLKNTTKDKLLIVAGGGGGSICNAWYVYQNGTGGGTNGGASPTTDGNRASQGGTQTTGYAYGEGQHASGDLLGGGGAGLYGGINHGGGSGYIGGVDNGSSSNGQNNGNGYTVITVSSVS